MASTARDATEEPRAAFGRTLRTGFGLAARTALAGVFVRVRGLDMAVSLWEARPDPEKAPAMPCAGYTRDGQSGTGRGSDRRVVEHQGPIVRRPRNALCAVTCLAAVGLVAGCSSDVHTR